MWIIKIHKYRNLQPLMYREYLSRFVTYILFFLYFLPILHLKTFPMRYDEEPKKTSVQLIWPHSPRRFFNSMPERSQTNGNIACIACIDVNDESGSYNAPIKSERLFSSLCFISGMIKLEVRYFLILFFKQQSTNETIRTGVKSKR